jgi:ParB family chromosome partitioning protein
MKKMREKLNSLDVQTNKPPVLLNILGIQFHETISSLFTRHPEMIEKIAKSITEKGYDVSEPIVIGIIKGTGDFVVDGHTRIEAAKMAGLDKIPVIYMDFENLEDAIQYTYCRQANRRNLTQSEILQAAILLKNKESRDGTGRNIEKLSDELGISASALVHAKTVAKRAEEKDIEAIRNGEKSINEIYRKIKTIKPKKQVTDDCEETETSLMLTVGIEDILRLLINNKELSAVNIILLKYRNLVSENFLSELGI